MSLERTDFHEFLKKRSKDASLVNQAVNRLGYLYAAVSGERFPLERAGSLNPSQLTDALSRVLGRPVKRVILVSASDDSTTKQLEPNEIVLLKRGVAIGASLWKAMWDRHHYIYETALKAVLGRDAAQFEQKLKQTNFGRHTYSTVRVALKRPPWAKHAACASDCLWDLTKYCLAFALTGRTKRAQSLMALVALCHGAIPLYERDSEPGTWIVLCA